MLVLAAMMPHTAFAQAAKAPAAEADNPNEIIVTGLRHSLEASLDTKRNIASIVEAVSAEEIGKLPDVSIGESIARLPGIAAQRVGGRAQILSVRGFPPDFTTVLLNGRQQASSGYNRAVEFDQYPSELLSSVVVYKSPDADIVGTGLAGTVDMRTIRPLAYGKRTIAMNIRGELDQGGGRNHDQSNKGFRGSISYIDQNKDGTLGWSLGYAHLDAPSHSDHTKNWFYDNYGGPAQILSGQEAFATTARDKRDGVMGTLEWKPSDAIHSTLDLYYSRFKQHQVNRGAEWFSDQWADNVAYSNLKTQTIGTNTVATSGHVTNAAPILRFDDNQRKDELFSVGFNNEYKIDDKTRFVADLSYSSNKRDETYIEAYGGRGLGPNQTRVMDSYDFNVPVDGFPQFTNFGLNYADAAQVSLGDKAPWGGWGHDGLLKSPHIKETVGSIDLGLSRDIDSFVSRIDVGFDWTHRKKTKTVDELDLFLKNNRQQIAVGSSYLTDPTSLSFAGMGSVLGVRIADAIGNYYNTVQLTDANHYDKAWGLTEDLLTFKVRANIDSGNLHGNVGVQVVRAKQQSAGLRINTLVSPLTIGPVSVSSTYTDVLPSLNLFYDLGQFKVRLAAAKVMARPRMDDMRANMTPGFNSAVCAGSPGCTPGQVVHPWSATGGNPNLQPWRAKELDVAVEWYGGKSTYLSVNSFYMWLDNYVYTQAIAADFSGFPLPATASSIPANVTISPIGQLTAPANGEGGYARGVEVSGAVEFGKLTPALEGFGAVGSVSYTDSYLGPNAMSAIGGTLPGLSPWVYSLTGYFEKNGFQARASYRYRSAFKGETVQLFANLGTVQILADKQLDAQIGYTFQKGSLEGLGLLLQVSNVLNSPYRTSYQVNGTTMLETYEKYGRQWLLGASYRF
ncbi:MAG: TonB-dependent receptor [Sphingomonadales bacterium]|nr:TonB-dependent receptor [Sphingomonadales bacterium]